MPSWVLLGGRFESAFLELEDVIESVRGFSDEVQFSPERLDEIEQRLLLLRRLQKKYGDGVDGVIEYRTAAGGKVKCH